MSNIEENTICFIDNNQFENNTIFEDDNLDSIITPPHSPSQFIPRINSPPVNIQIGPQHFDLLKLIGEGAFGKVLLVRSRLDKSLYAMKVISKKLLKKKNNIQYMKSERDILTKLNHPFIVILYFAFQSTSKLFLVMNFLKGGELFFHLKKKGIILEKEVKFYVSELILGIDFLHQNHIIHRDLKPENILLRDDGHITITDFGLAKEIGDSTVARTLCGTSEYMAPEMLTRNGYNKAVDWWSLGALCYEMLVGNAPFQAKSQKDLDRKILSEKFIAPSYLAPATHSLLKGLLEKDMNKRLGCVKSTMFNIGGVTALKQHSFFEFIDWNALERLEVDPPFNFIENTAVNADNNNDTTNFDEGFTQQVLSPSVIEDTLDSGMTSRVDPQTDEIVDEYEGFDYTTEYIEYTEDQLIEFQNILQSKIQKANKKKSLKLKKEEKLAIENSKRLNEASLLMQQESERQLKIQQEKERNAQLLAEQAKKAEALRILKEKQQIIDDHNRKVNTYLDELMKCQKRLKALRKKHRDVVELQEKISNLKIADPNYTVSKEQHQKLERLTSINLEIIETEKEEKNILASSPGELLPNVVIAENDTDNATKINSTIENSNCSIMNSSCNEIPSIGSISLNNSNQKMVLSSTKVDSSDLNIIPENNIIVCTNSKENETSLMEISNTIVCQELQSERPKVEGSSDSSVLLPPTNPTQNPNNISKGISSSWSNLVSNSSSSSVSNNHTEIAPAVILSTIKQESDNLSIKTATIEKKVPEVEEEWTTASMKKKNKKK